tara:strand:+ start:6535 stop:7254 length:720 start_codon:yes stop_codon:yes gene_type:complete
MSSYVDKEYFYYLRGRELLLYKLLGSRNRTRITQTGILQSYHNELMYPDEDITDGLRIEYTALNEPFISEAFESSTGYGSGTIFSFTNSSRAVLTGINYWWKDHGFTDGDKIRIQGSTSNDGEHIISGGLGVSISSGASTISLTSASTVTDESAGESITITQIPEPDTITSPSSTSHINLNKMLSLAVVDYVKAMIHEGRGEIDKKEYYIKEFYSKLADNESNKRIISSAFPVSPFAVR